ncbi:hypothetical protein PV327_006371 [Microctonus hyperodae]|uniref:Methylated-DNA--protein-cysteine methyltransferase n=1 Tax=Microctonus hyperodae TaxID=165561 RepID=A0AA39F470_MICHY|nr:hypothetical protein PV327_006371 [Microctonus hyperodae]
MVIKVFTMNLNEYNNAVNLSKFKIIYGIHSSPFGNCLIGVTDDQIAICHLWFFDNLSDVCLKIMEDEWPGIELIEDKSVTNEIIKSIFSDVDDNVSIFLKGTDFQINVWEALMNIPKGNTVTYSDVAGMIENPKAIRAVATAIASNRIGYLVPCHRVFPKNNSNTKFRWGVQRKFAMLNYEKATKVIN